MSVTRLITKVAKINLQMANIVLNVI